MLVSWFPSHAWHYLAKPEHRPYSFELHCFSWYQKPRVSRPYCKSVLIYCAPRVRSCYCCYDACIVIPVACLTLFGEAWTPSIRDLWPNSSFIPFEAVTKFSLAVNCNCSPVAIYTPTKLSALKILKRFKGQFWDFESGLREKKKRLEWLFTSTIVLRWILA